MLSSRFFIRIPMLRVYMFYKKVHVGYIFYKNFYVEFTFFIRTFMSSSRFF